MKLIKVVKTTYYIFCTLFFIVALAMIVGEVDIYSEFHIFEIILGVVAATGIYLAAYDIWNNWGR